MTMDSRFLRDSNTQVWLDLSTAPGADIDLSAALRAMSELEAGAIANPDEQRQVGHYWLRCPELTPAYSEAITAMHRQVETLAQAPAQDVLMIGIGGSALGPELAIDALAQHPERFHLLDSADPDGIARTLSRVDPARTTVIVASKSGGTVEPLTSLRAAQAHWAQSGRIFADDAIAITCEGSALHKLAEPWKARLPMWDWVGGRTSICSAIGLLPMALLGIDWKAFVQGSRDMDAWTRREDANPAAALAAAWVATGERNLVIEPYADRLRHLGRYLQQLIMESVGKSHHRDGRPAHHGRTVYGNKGSADQHALVQQLRDGPDDIFVHFVEVAANATTSPVMQDAADIQFSLLYGTRAALDGVGRPTVGITLPSVDAASLGALIALFERTVGLYSELMDINAYHQPGVEAGKRAAKDLIEDMKRIQAALTEAPQTAQVIAAALNMDPLATWRACWHLCRTRRAAHIDGSSPTNDRFSTVR